MKRMLSLLTISAIVVLKWTSSTASVLALGCCDALLIVTSLTFLRDAQAEATAAHHGDEHLVRPNNASQVSKGGVLLLVARDMALAATATFWLAALAMEDLTFSRFRYASSLTSHPVMALQFRLLAGSLVMVLVHVALNASLILMVRLFV